VSATIRISLAAVLLVSGARTLAAQAVTAVPSPTLPSDTLQANYAPRSQPGPMPELAPTLPSDTLEATQPVDSFPNAGPGGADSTAADSMQGNAYDQGLPQTPGDSAALRDLRTWIHRHPGLMAPPPVRAVLVRA
jgi:hypothetical protein